MKLNLKIMKRKILLLFLFTFLLLGNNLLSAQYKFHTMSPPGGFYSDGVKAIRQDNEGFIWILLRDELYRYDGYEYKRHSKYFTEINSSKEWRMLGIAIGENGKLYVNTNNGLFEYNRNQDRFLQIGKSNISEILLGPNDNLWVREGSNWYVLNTVTLERITLRYAGETSLHLSGVNCFYNEDFYLFSNYGHVYRYNPAKNDLTLCAQLPEKDKKIVAAHATKGKLWILTEPTTLYKLDLTNFNIEEKQLVPGELNSMLIRAFLFDKYGNLWIGAINGLFVYNPYTKTMKHFEHEEATDYSLVNNSVWTISEDFQRNI